MGGDNYLSKVHYAVAMIGLITSAKFTMQLPWAGLITSAKFTMQLPWAG